MSAQAAAQDPRQPSPPGAKVFFIEPSNGATVSSPLAVKFGISGMTLSPAGTPAEHAGHHHLLVDKKLADPMSPIPADDHHKHFGKAQTETSVTLTPGPHTLQLVLGDHNHIPHNPPVASDVITITVK
jgi:hypothetical protein